MANFFAGHLAYCSNEFSVYSFTASLSLTCSYDGCAQWSDEIFVLQTDNIA